MTSRSRSPVARGSTLLLAVVLLAVLCIIGAAAVSLGSAERSSVIVVTRRDRLVACAKAAQANLWNEMIRNARENYLGSQMTVPELRLSDGTILRGGHYDETSTIVVQTGAKAVPCKSNEQQEFIDLTNRDTTFSIMGGCFLVFARCVDDEGKQLEVEFGLNKVF